LIPLQLVCNAFVSQVQLLCNKSITETSHRQGVSGDFFNKKSKFEGSKAFQKHNKFITDSVLCVADMLRFTLKAGFRYSFCVAFRFATQFL